MSGILAPITTDNTDLPRRVPMPLSHGIGQSQLRSVNFTLIPAPIYVHPGSEIEGISRLFGKLRESTPSPDELTKKPLLIR
jgi:hypothetical protein